MANLRFQVVEEAFKYCAFDVEDLKECPRRRGSERAPVRVFL